MNFKSILITGACLLPLLSCAAAHASEPNATNINSASLYGYSVCDGTKVNVGDSTAKLEQYCTIAPATVDNSIVAQDGQTYQVYTGPGADTQADNTNVFFAQQGNIVAMMSRNNVTGQYN